MSDEVHLQMIQATISRIASQSMAIKGWCITLTATILGVGAATMKPFITALAIYTIVSFSILDAYYLALERGYRLLYRRAAEGQVADWEMAISPPGIRGVVSALCSLATIAFYGVSLAVALCGGGYVVFR